MSTSQTPESVVYAIRLATGGPLAGAWLSSILFGVELLGYIIYFRDFRHDQLFVRGCVMLSALLGIVSQIDIFVYAFLGCVIAWGDPVALLDSTTAFCVFMVTSGSLGFVAHIFLLRRVYLLSKSILYAVLLMLPVLLAFVGAIMAAVLAGTGGSTASGFSARLTQSLTIWLSASAGADILISATLLLLLSKFRSSFDHTQTLVRQTSIKTIETGCATSVLALVCLITFLLKPHSGIELGLAFVLARVYSLTLLSNVLSRNRNIKANGSSRAATDVGTFRKFTQSGHDQFDLSKIQVTIATQNDVSAEAPEEAGSTKTSKSEEAGAEARSARWA